MLSSMLSPYSSHRHAQLFKGKDQPDTSNTDNPTATPSIPVADPADEAIFQSAQPSASQAASEDASVPGSLLEKMLASWGFKSQPAAKPTGKKVSFQNNDEGPAKSSTAGEPASKKPSKARLRVRVEPGTHVKKATQSKPSPLQADDSGSPLAKTRSHGQDAPAKTNLVPIHEDNEDADSILQHSIPNLREPINQFLVPPPQLPADLENLPDFDSKSIKTPASSLWVEGTTGQASRMSSSFPPSRNPELPAETDDDGYGDDSDVESNASSAFWVDDDPDVIQEREELREQRGTKKWAKAVKNQQLGSLVAEQMSKGDIHENKNYLPGDSGLNSEDEALYYNSEDGNSDFESDIQFVRSAKPRQPVPTESLLTKTVEDPKFNLVTQHQKLLHESKVRISESMATESRIQDEQRIHRLQQKYSPKQLADNYRKLQSRLLLIESGLQSLREELKIPAYLTMTEQVDNWHNVLNNQKQDSTRELENLAAARRKGKMPEGQASSQWNALMQKRNEIEFQQQQVDSLLGRYNDREAYGVQIKSKLALYQAALLRNRHDAQMNLLTQATNADLSHDERVEHWQKLGQLYPSAELKLLKQDLAEQPHTDSTKQLEVLDQAIKYQDTMVRNILSRLREAATGANHQQAHAIKLSQEFSKDFSRVELQEASQRIPQEKDLNRLQGRSILNEALFLKSKQQEN